MEINKCKVCKKTIGRIDGERLVEVDEGVIQVGQGRNKPLISFCSRECYDKFNKLEEGLKWKEVK